jgi:hypothetical protein
LYALLVDEFMMALAPGLCGSSGSGCLGSPVRVLALAENAIRQGGRMKHYAPKGIVGPLKSE